MSKIAASGMPITPEGELSAAAAAARANPLDDAAFGTAVAAMRAQLEAWAGRAGSSALPPLDRSTLLALDIDGTILDINGEVPPRTRAAGGGFPGTNPGLDGMRQWGVDGASGPQAEGHAVFARRLRDH